MPTLPLRDLQAAFWRHVAATPGDEPGRPIAPALGDALVGTPDLPAAERLAIYRRMYVWRLVDVLRDDAPRTAAVLGDAFFDVARGYLAEHPSEHPSVAMVGRALADFLAARPPAGAPPWIADICRLEWTRRRIFEAPDAPAITRDALAALPREAWPGARIRLVPALARLAVGWPVHRAWGAEEGAVPPLPAEPTVLRVWRSGWTVFHAPMDAREDAALARALAGEPFASVCEAFADLPGDQAAAEAASLVVTWVADGMVRALEPADG